MSELTAEQLIDAIRKADRLRDLKQLVGASEKAIEMSDRRISRIDEICDEYGYDVKKMPIYIVNEYKVLNQFQDEFRRDYC